jgi:uncharacterized protein (TIGR00251 family)
MPTCIRISGDRIYLSVKAIPGASASRILDIQGDRLRVKIAAAPEDGKANAELCVFLAKTLGCPKKEVSLESGEKSRLKTVTLPLSVLEKLVSIQHPTG